MSLFSKALRAGEGKNLKVLDDLARRVNDLESKIESLSDEELAAKTVEFRERLANGESLDDLEAEAYAVVREAAQRVLGQRHYDVQVVGAGALHRGMIAEMRTGEGKTLVSTMPVYLNALAQKGVHIVTVNDYLASRDAEWMGGIHRFLGLTVGLIQSGDDPTQRRPSYEADVTYGTNNEFGFDYLRDNMAMGTENLSQRTHNYAIVDEVDSILVDEARTPLIISGRIGDTAKWYRDFARIVDGLREGDHYEIDEGKRQVLTTEDGVSRVEQILGIENMYDHAAVDFCSPSRTGLAGQDALSPRCRIPPHRRRSEDRRRVHRPGARGSPVLRGSASGHRGQRGRAHQRREPDAGHHNSPKLLPALREVGGNDGDGIDGGV